MIALGRLFMAALFLIAVWLELGNPAEAPPATAILAVAYMFFAAAILVATWNSWWADARLAGAAHSLDIAMFTLMVLLTHGYTSPFFTFFMFLLLSAAIRWGWKATALTAVLVTLLYLIVGLVDVRATADFNLQRFLVRTGHLVILSLILIWFGINQWRSRLSLSDREFLANPSVEIPPVEASLGGGRRRSAHRSGAFAWWEQGRTARVRRPFAGASWPGTVSIGRPVDDKAIQCFPLRSRKRSRAVAEAGARTAQRSKRLTAIDSDAAKALALTEGLAIPVRQRPAGGESCSWRVSRPIDRSPRPRRPDCRRRRPTCSAMPWFAQPKTTPRRDHAYRSPAISTTASFNSSAGLGVPAGSDAPGAGIGADVGPELDELKKLMLEEQGELGVPRRASKRVADRAR